MKVNTFIYLFNFVRRVVRPWLGLKMIDLNDMIVAQLKEKGTALPNVTKGVLVPMVWLPSLGFLSKCISMVRQ